MTVVLLGSAAVLALVGVVLSVASFRGQGQGAALKGMVAMILLLAAAVPALVYGGLDG
jgi:hypothetical protein